MNSAAHNAHRQRPVLTLGALSDRLAAARDAAPARPLTLFAHREPVAAPSEISDGPQLRRFFRVYRENLARETAQPRWSRHGLFA